MEYLKVITAAFIILFGFTIVVIEIRRKKDREIKRRAGDLTRKYKKVESGFDGDYDERMAGWDQAGHISNENVFSTNCPCNPKITVIEPRQHVVILHNSTNWTILT